MGTPAPNVITGIPAPSPFLHTPGEPAITWNNWVKTFDNYLLAVGLDEAKEEARCRALLISCLGVEGQRILYTFDSATVASLADLKKVMKAYFVGSSSKWTHRLKFNERKQKPGESIEKFTADLRQIAASCDFKPSSDPLNEALLGQLIIGITDNRVREKLLLQDDSKLTFATAVETAKEYERVTQESNTLRTHTPTSSSNAYQIRSARPRERNFGECDASNQNSGSNAKMNCYRCGSSRHVASYEHCIARDKKCNNCKKVGHFMKMCRLRSHSKKNTSTNRRNRSLSADRHRINGIDKNDEVICTATVCSTRQSGKRLTADLILDGELVRGVIDSGASVSILPLEMANQLWSGNQLNDSMQECELDLRTFSNEKIPIRGKVELRCCSPDGQEESTIPFIVSLRGKDVLFGLDTIRSFRCIGKQLSALYEEANSSVNECFEAKPNQKPDTKVKENPQNLTFPKTHEQPDVTTVGCIKGYIHKVRINPEVKPVRQQLRQIPFSIRNQVSEEVHRLLDADIIERVEASEWISNLVIVQKTDGRLRICVDLRSANQAVIVDGYPIPRIEELLSSMKNCCVFSKLDLSEAYLQLPLHEESRDLTTFVVPDGLFRFKRCPFGLASCPSAFQAVMSKILKGIDGVCCYLDDVLVSAPSAELHEERLNEVLKRLSERNIKLNEKKCCLRVNHITYLGHDVDKTGIKPAKDKIKALLEAPAPTSISELRTTLGAFGYYARHIPNFSTLVEPLRKIVNETSFSWPSEAQVAFQKLKHMISDSSALAPFDISLPIIVSTDASNVGLGATLSIVDPQFGVRTVEFASKRLTDSERKFSTTEKEALALVWACERWRAYLLGRRFTLETDHEPLRMIFSKKGFDRMSLRLARWATRLMAFNFEVKYKRGCDNTIPDYCSRFPIEEMVYLLLEEDEEDVAIISTISIQNFQEESEKCQELTQVRNFVEHGWPKKKDVPEELRPYFGIRHELSIHKEQLLRGRRIIVPTRLRDELIHLAHESHMGIQRTKSQIRSLYWWPAMDKRIEEMINTCYVCQNASKTFKSGPKPSMEKLPIPESPMQRVAVDIKGPMYHLPPHLRYAIVVIDLHSKWPEVTFVPNVETEKVIEALDDMFSREGLPCEVLSDNGTQFTSATFHDFLFQRNIVHVKAPVYNPESNAVVERFNRTLSEQIELALMQNIPVPQYIRNFLHTYRSSTHPSILQSPSYSLHGRDMRTKLTSLASGIKRKSEGVLKKSVKFEEPFSIGEKVCVKHPVSKTISRGLTIMKMIGSRSAILSNGRKWHTKHLSKDRSIGGEKETEEELPDLFGTYNYVPGTPRRAEPRRRGHETVGREEQRRRSDRRRREVRHPDYVYY